MSRWRWLAPRLPTLALMAVGLAGLYVASGLSFGTINAPGTGFFPTVICSLIVLFTGMALADGEGQGASSEEASGEARLWGLVAGLAVYGWALEPVGFLLATTALLLLLLRGIGRVRWTVSAPAAVIGTTACYLAFTRLGVPLPAGMLGF